MENQSLTWYKSLNINQKLALKEVTELICGLKWEHFSLLFSPRERIEIIHQKLLEDFILLKTSYYKQ